MNAVHHQALKRLRVLHLHRAPESKALGVSQILPEHIVARAVRLVFDIAKYFIQHSQSVVLIDQKILVGKADIFFALNTGYSG